MKKGFLSSAGYPTRTPPTATKTPEKTDPPVGKLKVADHPEVIKPKVEEPVREKSKVEQPKKVTTAIITAKNDIQDKIDELAKNKNLQRVTIKGPCAAECVFELNLPKLEELVIINCTGLWKVVLNDKLTPKLRKLVIHKPAQKNFHLDVKCSKLWIVSMRDMICSDGNQMHNLLTAAKQLVTFDSYKLFFCPLMAFASPVLKKVRLHRCEQMMTCYIYSPVLESLDLQGCFNVEHIDIEDQVEGFPKLDFKTASRFAVNLKNCLLVDEGDIQRLHNHIRISGVYTKSADTDGYFPESATVTEVNEPWGALRSRARHDWEVDFEEKNHYQPQEKDYHKFFKNWDRDNAAAMRGDQRSLGDRVMEQLQKKKKAKKPEDMIRRMSEASAPSLPKNLMAGPMTPMFCKPCGPASQK